MTNRNSNNKLKGLCRVVGMQFESGRGSVSGGHLFHLILQSGTLALFLLCPRLCWNSWNRSHRGSCRGLWMEWIMSRSLQIAWSNHSFGNCSSRNTVRTSMQFFSPAQYHMLRLLIVVIQDYWLHLGHDVFNDNGKTRVRVHHAGWRGQSGIT